MAITEMTLTARRMIAPRQNRVNPDGIQRDLLLASLCDSLVNYAGARPQGGRVPAALLRRPPVSLRRRGPVAPLRSAARLTYIERTHQRLDAFVVGKPVDDHQGVSAGIRCEMSLLRQQRAQDRHELRC